MTHKIELKTVHIREFDEDGDIEMVGRLERNCEGVTKKGVFYFTNMMGDPLSRIRFYPLHIMLVAELLESRELVGVIRGCIKNMGTARGAFMKMGYILGLRVSPSHRRMGIGLKLVKSVEEWMLRNGATYTFLATEKNNKASASLFTLKCNYVNLSSLVIFVQPTSFPIKHMSEDVIIEKLPLEKAISLYRTRLNKKDLYPTDMDSILSEKLSLGTWISYFKHDEGHINLDKISSSEHAFSSSWVMFSIWNTCKAYKLQLKKPQPLGYFQTSLSHAIREKILKCLRLMLAAGTDSVLSRPFGFLFLYGLHGEGEGEKLGDLMGSIWSFTSRLAENIKGCKLVITELGHGDPLEKHFPLNSSISCTDDLWYTKRLAVCNEGKNEELLEKGQLLGNVFVDPRDF